MGPEPSTVETDVTLEPSWFQSVVAGMADIVCAVDATGTVLYVNDAIRTQLGFEPAALLGTSALAFVHVDDQARAMQTLLYATQEESIPSVLPFRFVSSGGEVVPFEIMAESRLSDPEIGCSIIVAREARQRELGEATLEALAGGVEFSETLNGLIRILDRPEWGLACSIVFDEPDGSRGNVSFGLEDHPDLEGVDLTADAPWTVALTQGSPVEVTELGSLPNSLRDLAKSAGFEAVWAHPAPDPSGNGDACVVVWSPRPVGPVLGEGLALERVLRLLRLALAQRDQLVRLRHAAQHDSLTRLPNRDHFRTRVQIEMVERDYQSVGVIFLDLDGFKPVNDRFGHQAGDRVLQSLANRMRHAVRPSDLVARLGGDEFGILCVDLDDKQVLVHVAERVGAAISEPIEIEGELVRVGASFGLVLADGRPFDELLQAADSAMYDAKGNPGEAWVFAD